MCLSKRLILVTICLLFTLFSSSCFRSTRKDSSSPSSPSEPPSYQIRDLEASVLQHHDEIRLTWSVEPEPGGDIQYYVYRSKSRTDAGAPIAVTSVNFFEDKETDESGPQKDTPYFYSVTRTKDGVEYGEPTQCVLGLFSSVIDVFEPDDDYTEASLLVKNQEIEAYLFAFKDEKEEPVVDTDWYVFAREDSEVGKILQVKIEFPEDSPFIGKTKIWFSESGSISGEGEELRERVNRHNYFLDEGVGKVHLRIRPLETIDYEGTGSYRLKVWL